MVEKDRTVLLNANTRWHGPIKIKLRTYTFKHVVTQWNNNPRKDLQCNAPNKNAMEFRDRH